MGKPVSEKRISFTNVEIYQGKKGEIFFLKACRLVLLQIVVENTSSRTPSLRETVGLTRFGRQNENERTMKVTQREIKISRCLQQVSGTGAAAATV